MKNIKMKITLCLLAVCFTILPAVTAMAGRHYSLRDGYPASSGTYYVNEEMLIAVDQNFNWLVSSVTYAASPDEQVPGIMKLSGMPTFTLDIATGGRTVAHYDMAAFGTHNGVHRSVLFTPQSTGTYQLTLNVSGENDGKYEVEDTRTFTVTERTHKTITTSDRPRITVKRTGRNKAKITCVNIYGRGFKMEVYRSTKKNGKYKLIKSIGKSTYTDTKLKASKTYYYKVRFVVEVDEWTTKVSRFSAAKAAKKK